MGLAGRDYMHAPRPSRRRRAGANVVGVILLVAVLALGAWIVTREDDPATRFVLSPLGLSGVEPRASEPRLYPVNDPWKDYLASEDQCPGGESTKAPLATQPLTILCLLNWARGKRGLPPLPQSAALSQAALLKAQDIYRCRDFAHDACGRKPNAVALSAGYDGVSWGENLYAGALELGAPRVATDGWLNSHGHRENLFRSQWDEQGIAVLRAPRFNGQSDVTIWVSQFGRRRR